MKQNFKSFKWVYAPPVQPYHLFSFAIILHGESYPIDILVVFLHLLVTLSNYYHQKSSNRSKYSCFNVLRHIFDHLDHVCYITYVTIRTFSYSTFRENFDHCPVQSFQLRFRLAKVAPVLGDQTSMQLDEYMWNVGYTLKWTHDDFEFSFKCSLQWITARLPPW